MKTPRNGRLVAVELEIGLEARDLAPVGVPVDLEVGETEVGAVDEDHPRAGAEDGSVEAPDRLVEAVEGGEPQDRRRLAARDHEPVEPVELLGEAHLHDLRAGGAEHPRVLAKRPLEGENTDSGPMAHTPKV